MLLLNFTHPLTDSQRAQVAALLGGAPEIRSITVQIDQAQELTPQLVTLADAVGLSAEQWQTTPLIVNPPGFAPACAGLLAEIHGRSGQFPALLRLRPVPGSTPTSYEVAEIINLQALRAAARQRR